MILLHWIGRFFLLLRRLLNYTLMLLALVFVLQRSTYPLGLEWNAVETLVKDHTFDYLTWEVNALAAKTEQMLYGAAPFMTEVGRSQYVRTYMSDLAHAQQLEAQVTALFTDPNVADPMNESAALRAERDALRTDLRGRQGLAEAILEGQVATVLVEQGFGTLGQLMPPMSMRFTELPNLLAVSPRDKISLDVYINIDALPVDEMAALEQTIDQQVEVSSLVIPLGGIALYPAMIAETSSIPFVVNTFAHEWLHHYLYAFPLGLNYDFTGEVRIINETTANLFGGAIGPLVLARYYPDLAQKSDVVTLISQTTPSAPFDFAHEMDVTRRHVDALLADGKVDEAEAYMEERRRVFVDHGYAIRKLNQAYFAFYGGYQAGEGSVPGVGGADPIGPAVQRILDHSASLHDFVVTMRDITTRDALLATAAQIGITQG